MIIKITNVCNMGCNHCFDSCNQEGIFMSRENFIRALEFTKEVGNQILIISGGEPTLHPEFFDFIELAKKHYSIPAISILSNGLWLDDDKLTYRMKKLNISIQITNDERYYPKRIKKQIHKNFIYEHHIRTLVPIGRAHDREAIGIKAPGCFNIRSMGKRNRLDIRDIVRMQQQRFKFCTPLIKPNGDVTISEYNSCASIGTVYDSLETLTNNIYQFSCNKCPMYKSLPEDYKKIIK